MCEYVSVRFTSGVTRNRTIYNMESSGEHSLWPAIAILSLLSISVVLLGAVAKAIRKRTDIQHPIFAILFADLCGLIVSVVICVFLAIGSISMILCGDFFHAKSLVVAITLVSGTVVNFNQISWLAISALR